MPPKEYKLTVFYEVYTPDALSRIDERAKHDKGLKGLNRILRSDNEYSKIDRIHLDKCLHFAKENGGLDADKISRLSNPNDLHEWKSTYNEFLVPYFFTKVFKHKIEFVINPEKKGLGDFHIVRPEGKVIVEVKTPKGDDPDMQEPKESVRVGLDKGLLKSVFFDGAKQLKRGNKNLIVICTQHCAWICDWRPFEKLFYGKEVITAAFDNKIGRVVEPMKTKFTPDGELNRHKKKRFTRISAIASFKNDIYCGSPFSEEEQQIQFTLLHNYHAVCPIDQNLFPDLEQFVPDKEKGSIEHLNKDKRGFLIEG
ncbi:MAG: hypothetical protein HQ580_06415 [Planctomycetes bacterium]|nr:hypothetical protein [Planctomycetota bacterium]